jgi:hypothetical protein
VVSERDEIIESARMLDANALASAPSAARYERVDDRRLGAAIDIIAAHGRADEQTGDRTRGRHGARIGRYVLWSDPHKVAALQTFASERAASRTLELGGLYLAGNTGRGSGGIRIGRYVLWGDMLQPYANEKSASGARTFGLVPGAVKSTDDTPEPRATRTWRNTTVIRRAPRQSWRRPIWFVPRIKDPNLWWELHVGPIVPIRFKRQQSMQPRPQITVAPAGSPAGVRTERRLREIMASDPRWRVSSPFGPSLPPSNGKHRPQRGQSRL